MPRISAPMCRVSGTTSNLVLVMTVMAFPQPFYEEATGRSLFGRDRCLRVAMGLAVLDLAGRQGGEDLFDQRARRFRTEFDRDPLAPAFGLVDEVDAERVVERRVEGVIVVDIGGIDPHPAVRSLGAAGEPCLLADLGAHGGSPWMVHAARAAAGAARCFVKNAKTLFQPSSACSGR